MVAPIPSIRAPRQRPVQQPEAGPRGALTTQRRGGGEAVSGTSVERIARRGDLLGGNLRDIYIPASISSHLLLGFPGPNPQEGGGPGNPDGSASWGREQGRRRVALGCKLKASSTDPGMNLAPCMSPSPGSGSEPQVTVGSGPGKSSLFPGGRGSFIQLLLERSGVMYSSSCLEVQPKLTHPDPSAFQAWNDSDGSWPEIYLCCIYTERP